MIILRRLTFIALGLLIAGPLAFSFTEPDADAQGANASLSLTTAAAAECADDLLGGQAPTIPASMDVGSRQLCYADFTLLHSGTSRTALWSAQRITRDSIAAARAVPRTNEFYAEDRLPRDERSELSDYSRSGFDRGHLAPSADMPSFAGERESFSLANIIPQRAGLNRNSWADLESDVRSAARRFGTAYIVTGPLFVGESIQTLRGRVFIPSHVWKAVHIPGRGSIVIVASNDQRAQFNAFSISQFVAHYGIDPFPALDPHQDNRVLSLGDYH